MQTVKIGGVPEHFNLPWHLAIESKKFEAESIHLEWQDFPGGTGAMCQALQNREIDLALVLTEGMITAIANGNSAQILQYYVTSPLQWGVHVAAHSEYQNPEQINGKIYAISRYRSGSHLMAYVDAHQRGWDLEKLQFKVVGNLDGAREALRNQEADVFFWEKYTTQPYVDCGEFRRISVCPTPWSCFVLAARKEIVQEKPKVVQSIQSIINQTCQEIAQQKKYDELISKRYALKLQEVQAWLKLTNWETEAKIDLKSLEKVVHYLKMLQIIPDDFEAKKLI